MKSVHIFHWISLSIITLAVLLLLILPLLRINFSVEIYYDEGWNIYHGLRATSGQLLYDDRNKWTILNYPPLSFYVVGGIGKLLNNPLLVGRYIALVSTFLVSFGVGYLVRKIHGRVFEGVLAGILCMGFFAANATAWIGMNNPQMLGHTLMLSGLILYLRDSSGYRPMFLIALLFTLGLFTKHNLISIPLSVAIDTFIRSRREFFKFAGVFGLLVLGLTFCTMKVAGGDFLTQLTIVRGYNFDRLLFNSFRVLGIKMAIPLIVLLPWVFSAVKNSKIRVIPIYLLTSIGVGLALSGATGADVNHFFDVIISVTISLGIFLSFCRTGEIEIFKTRRWVYSILPICFALGIFVTIGVKISRAGDKDDYKYNIWNWGMYDKLKKTEQRFLEDAVYLSSKPGPVLCESLLMSYFGGKPFIFDPYNSSQRMVTGLIDEKEILSKLESGYFSIVQLNETLNNRYFNIPDYTSIKKNYYNGLKTENMTRAIGNYYTLKRKTVNGAFYFYRHQ